jgi:hypothetical protein
MNLFSLIKSPSTYVIKEWFANETPNENGVYIEITGRKSGLISWVLARVGIDPIVSLVVDSKNVRFKEGGMSDFSMVVTPVDRLCSGQYGYSKPFWWNVLFVLIGLFFVIDTKGISILLVLWGLYSYYFNKTITLGLNYLDGNGDKFGFKRSLIEGKNIDEAAAGRIIAIIEMIVQGSDKPNFQPDITPANGTEAREQARQKVDAFRAQAMQIGGRAATKVAASLSAASENIKRETPAEALKCPACTGPIMVDDVFCGNCGHTLR